MSRSDVADTNFFCSLLRRALIRTLNGSALDPVHARVRRRGAAISLERTHNGAKRVLQVHETDRSHPDGTSKEQLKLSVCHNFLDLRQSTLSD